MSKDATVESVLGVEPEWAWKRRRIQVLSDAIVRQLRATPPKYDLIQKWSSEIERLSWDLKEAAATEEAKKASPLKIDSIELNGSQIYNVPLDAPMKEYSLFDVLFNSEFKTDLGRVLKDHKEFLKLLSMIPGAFSAGDGFNFRAASEWIQQAHCSQSCAFEKGYQVGDEVEFYDCSNVKRVGRITEEQHTFDIVDERSGAQSSLSHANVPLSAILGRKQSEA